MLPEVKHGRSGKTYLLREAASQGPTTRPLSIGTDG